MFASGLGFRIARLLGWVDDGGEERPLPDAFHRPFPAGLDLSVALGAKATLLREGEVRVVTVKLSFLVIPAPGVTAGSARPFETLLSPVGEFVASEGGPIPMAEPPPQDARKGREKAPEGRAGPDGPQESETAPGRERADCGEERCARSRQDEGPGVSGWIPVVHGLRLRA
ncbi:MAG: hypothetical protein F4X91_05025 [Nitrospinae bacterium]|nr:hypothetical protein [Nitrospinota bacterium]